MRNQMQTKINRIGPSKKQLLNLSPEIIAAAKAAAAEAGMSLSAWAEEAFREKIERSPAAIIA